MATTTDNFSRRADALDGTLSRSFAINWEVAAYIVIFMLAIFTRFHMLGERAMSHDESLHTYYSFELYKEGEFRHTPLMHGPILFHATAFFYTLFGDNDFSARIYAALLGLFMVMSPVLFRYWLGRWGALLASVMILISPLLMYYNRYIREDTPAIMASILMAWAIFMYLAGPVNQRRRAHWLYILCAAMIWNLGSKETAFFYVAIFGLFLTLFWIARLVQYFWNIPTRASFTTFIMGWLLAGVASMGMYIILDIAPVERVAQVTPGLEWMSGVMTGGGLQNSLIWFAVLFIGVSVLAFLMIALVVAAYQLGRAAQRMMQVPERYLPVYFVIGGVIVSLFIAALIRLLDLGGLYAYLDARSLLVWSGLVFAFVIVSVIATAVWVFRERGGELPWREILIIGMVAVFMTVGFIVMEEFSHVNAEDVSLAVPVVPGEEGAATTNGRAFTWSPIVLAWALSLGFIGLLVYSRSAGWWDTLKKFPELDVMWVMGALILPWLTAVFIVATRGTTQDFEAIGETFSGISGVMPVSGTLQIGQVIVGFLAWLPLMILSIVAGLVWDWRRFIMCWLVFHGIFAFFFTTIFTNIAGLATGMVYSLQYWLEQQAERRGSQPQYYYLLIILPMYEYLPIIGSVLAMFAGLVVYWRRRVNQTKEAVLAAIIEQPAEDESGSVVAAADSVDSADVYLSDLIANDPVKRKRGDLPSMDDLSPAHLVTPPFLLFVSWWAIFVILALTLAGEKMPWLGTHMTLPMIFIAGWYFGRIFEKIDFSAVVERRGWMYLLLFPILFVLLFQVFALPLGDQPPFAGITQQQLQATYGWLGVLALTLVVMFIIYRQVEFTGWRLLRQMLSVAVFVVLAAMTFRAALYASFVNYDLATEYLVYAHATTGTKIVQRQLEELSQRTTNGMALKFAYDDKMSWPGVWYFRNFTNEVFMGGNPTLQQMNDAVVVLVGEANRSTVEPLLEDRYQRFEYTRMWWPSMDYFDLTPSRIIDTFTLSPDKPSAPLVRRGLFDIWWSRNYTNFGKAINKDFSLENWPVGENMYMFIRRDVVTQIWPYGLGEGTVSNPVNSVAVSACVANWNDAPALRVFGGGGQLTKPLNLDIGADGLVYIAEEGASRIAVFDQQGNFVRSIGQRGTRDQAGAFFERPNSVAVAANGDLYVVDSWNYLVRAFDASGEPMTQWGTPLTMGMGAPADPVDGFWIPRDIAVDVDGTVYVSDTGNKRIRVYDANGTWLRDIGRGGSAQGQLDEPAGVALGADGNLYVADTWNQRVSVFKKTGEFVLTFNVRAWYEQFGNLPYIAVDSTRNLVYVTDPDGGRVLVYNTGGECVGAFGRLERNNPNNAQFSTVGGITVNDAGEVFVTDLATGRVLVFPPFAVPQVLTIESSAEVLPLETLEVTPEVIVTDEVAVTEETTTTEDVTPEVTVEE